jgi:aldose 1-epimerase
VIARSLFGSLADGRRVEQFLVASGGRLEVRAISFGAILVSIRTVDVRGRMADVVLGFDTLDGYVNQTAYFGAIVGRHANRIARGRFVLDGRRHQLNVNDGPNHLHGGPGGFDKQLWDATPISTADGDGVLFTRTSPDGEEHYPGALQASVRYLVRRDDVLEIECEATADAPTIVNLAQHTYFNLSGDPTREIVDHTLVLEADEYTPVDDTMIPTGEILPVAGTPFDFRQPAAIGSRIDVPDEQLRRAGGYDHNWVVRAAKGTPDAPVARLWDPRSGRRLIVESTQPGLQFYSGNLLDGSAVGKRGIRYHRRTAVCLESQHFPDGPNQPGFPSPMLRPGQTYQSRTTWRFDVTARA